MYSLQPSDRIFVSFFVCLFVLPPKAFAVPEQSGAQSRTRRQGNGEGPTGQVCAKPARLNRLGVRSYENGRQADDAKGCSVEETQPLGKKTGSRPGAEAGKGAGRGTGKGQEKGR